MLDIYGEQNTFWYSLKCSLLQVDNMLFYPWVILAVSQLYAAALNEKIAATCSDA
jgi:malic enzyme